MTFEELVIAIKKKKSFLCVGLDTDLKKIPAFLVHQSEDPVFEFNKRIIDATLEFAVAYKPNLAFYEALGADGLRSLKKTIHYINGRAFTIADAKRGDIGNTASMYAESFFNHYGFDAVTLAPYMGVDSAQPFFEHNGKWSIVLGITSNPGAEDFELLQVGEEKLFEIVLRKFTKAATHHQLMFVAGATRPEMFRTIRKHAPHHFLLVPGVGAQGGSLTDVCHYGLNSTIGLLINSSREIIYASAEVDFDAKAAGVAKNMQLQMQAILEARNLLIS
jgi:orotidine-5'-phosphate decarboxylase